jgi:hypothetical protein
MKNEPSGANVRFNEHAACSFCGRYGAFDLGHQLLCPTCYEGCGSCCPEFGREDLQAMATDDLPEPPTTDVEPGSSGPLAGSSPTKEG